jgi:hypothetical protein
MKFDYRNTFGQKQEREVIQTLIDNDLEVSPPTKHEDLRLDIDVWVRNLPISIKCPTKKSVEYFKRIVLEFEVMFANGTWQPSWWQNGQAHGYLFLLGDEIYYADKEAFKRFMDYYEDDEDVVRWRSLTRKTQEAQRRKGHPHVNAKNANVKIDALLEEGVFVFLGKLGEKIDGELLGKVEA